MGEVPPGAERKDPELGARAEPGPQEPVDDLVGGAVAADDDELGRAVSYCLACKLGQVAGALRDQGVAA